MKHNNKEIKDGIHQIQKAITALTKEYGADIFEKTNILIQAYIDHDDILATKSEEEIFALFDQAFIDSYKITSKGIQDLYPGKVQGINVANVQELTYSDDGKTFNERVQGYFDDAKHKVTKDTETIVKQSLRKSLYRILDTELKNVSETIKKNKKPIPEEGIYVIQVIEGCGGDCGHDCIEYNGIYSIDEDIPWPPYHPSCTGIGYYDYTDDPSEIEDLDLDDTDLDENI